MPPITRSRDELARIVALLEDETYASAEALAYAVLKEAADIITDRHTFVVWSKQYPDVGWGVFYTEAQAEKAWRMEIGPVLGTEGGTLLRVAPFPATPAVVHEVTAVRGLSLQSLYHFTIGGPVEDGRLMTLPPYHHLHR